ncbi:Uncharacterized protein PCOAH_00049130 [Plasmodium coatneyi]|uniref:Uncharacterized protein n=1 Tax=Plasmodium coatneyi TaxID=208452 RepID=A0A1B1E678_9APIC|nr:Uncharacterized protein PCOAH_00049130 [Plasmodium coatneyi]ANQ10477.1 Uncharacterized protein PCOAH_00049130 [Plasmodium coatneyi]
MPLSKRNDKVLRSLARTVGKLCQFFDDNQVWKSLLSNVYRYENEKCSKYNDFLKSYLSSSVHYCPTKSSKKKLRGELFKYLRDNLKKGGKEPTEDVFLVGFTAIRHLGRVKNSLLLALSSTGNLPITHRYNSRVCVPNRKNIWHCDEEKDLFKRNFHVVNFGAVEQDDLVGEGSSGKGKKRGGAYRKGEQGQSDGGNKTPDVSAFGEADKPSIPAKRTKSSIVLKKPNHKQEIKKGMILVAHPLTSSTLWNRSIILITHRDKSNLVCGIILNKHPLYNSYMGMSNDKEIINILNKLYLKKRNFLGEFAEGVTNHHGSDRIRGKGESQAVVESSDQVDKAARMTCPVEEEPQIENVPSDASQMQVEGSAEKDNQPKREEEGLVLLQNQCIAKEEEKNVIEKKYQIQTRRESRCEHQSSGDEFPTLKDLQEMFLRIQFRSSSKHYANRQRKQKNVIPADGNSVGIQPNRKNSLFVMMDEHLLDIITHYIIKLNKVPIYLRFLPSYNIGSIIDIKKEIKKLQFLNEFYKIYFEKYNKWKVVVINNRIHIFDKEKKKKKKKFPHMSVHTELGGTARVDLADGEASLEKTQKTQKLTEEEIQQIHKKIRKFQETNQLCDDEVEGDKEHSDEKDGRDKRKERQKGQRKKSDGRKSVRKSGADVQANDENCVAADDQAESEYDEGDDNEDYDEEDEDDDDEEDDMEEDDEEDDEEEEEDLVEEEEELEEEAYQNEDSSGGERLTQVHTAQEQVDSSTPGEGTKVEATVNGRESDKKNHLERNPMERNPLNFFWLGGPLPGLTILHNIKKFSKNTVVNDFIYEGYNENVNLANSSDVHEVDGRPDYLVAEGVPLDGAKKESAPTEVHHHNEANQSEQATTHHADPTQVEITNSDKRMEQTSEEENKLVKRFIGKATWDINQLLDELNNDYWIALNCDSKELLSSIIFNTAGGGNAGSATNGSAYKGSPYKGEFLWEKIVASINSDYESISNIPQSVIDSVLRDFRGVESD